jgi:hypothetical protein
MPGWMLSLQLRMVTYLADYPARSRLGNPARYDGEHYHCPHSSAYGTGLFAGKRRLHKVIFICFRFYPCLLRRVQNEKRSNITLENRFISKGRGNYELEK